MRETERERERVSKLICQSEHAQSQLTFKTAVDLVCQNADRGTSLWCCDPSPPVSMHSDHVPEVPEQRGTGDAESLNLLHFLSFKMTSRCTGRTSLFFRCQHGFFSPKHVTTDPSCLHIKHK